MTLLVLLILLILTYCLPYAGLGIFKLTLDGALVVVPTLALLAGLIAKAKGHEELLRKFDDPILALVAGLGLVAWLAGSQLERLRPLTSATGFLQITFDKTQLQGRYMDWGGLPVEGLCFIDYPGAYHTHFMVAERHIPIYERRADREDLTVNYSLVDHSPARGRPLSFINQITNMTFSITSLPFVCNVKGGRFVLTMNNGTERREYTIPAQRSLGGMVELVPGRWKLAGEQ